MNYHPEVLKNLEILHNHTEHNIQIDKELVYKMVTELFIHEINKLDWEDRKKMKNQK